MIQRAPHDIDAQILEAMVAPEQATLGTALARALLSCGFQPEQKQEIDRLLSRNNAGKLTDTQQARLDAYIRVGNLVTLLQAKARVSLADKSGRR
jgi:hypothetical protein